MEITKGENANLAGMEPRLTLTPEVIGNGWYSLQIDGKHIWRFDRRELDLGLERRVAEINAELRSPAPTPPLVDNNPVVCSMRAAVLAFGGDEDLEKEVTEGRMNMQGEWPTPPLDVEAEKRITDIRERESKATKGPWTKWVEHPTVFCENNGTNSSFEMSGSQICECEPDDLPDLGGDEEENEEIYAEQAECNAEFIAHSRLDIPFLLEQRDFLLEQISLLRRHIASPAPQPNSLMEKVVAFIESAIEKSSAEGSELCMTAEQLKTLLDAIKAASPAQPEKR